MTPGIKKFVDGLPGLCMPRWCTWNTSLPGNRKVYPVGGA